jgi:hypothetical protein
MSIGKSRNAKSRANFIYFFRNIHGPWSFDSISTSPTFEPFGEQETQSMRKRPKCLKTTAVTEQVTQYLANGKESGSLLGAIPISSQRNHLLKKSHEKIGFESQGSVTALFLRSLLITQSKEQLPRFQLPWLQPAVGGGSSLLLAHQRVRIDGRRLL